MTSPQTITWPCAVCDKPIHDGYLRIRHADIHAHDEARAAFDAEHPPELGITLAEFQGAPKPVKWVPLHAACDDEPDRGDLYTIEVKNLATHRDVLSWTGHMMDKAWLPSTDWQGVISWALDTP